MARRVVNSSIRDRRRRILGLSAPNAGWSPVSSAEAIDQMRHDVHTYYLDTDGTRRRIYPYRRGRKWFLRAKWDAEVANNLATCAPPDPGWSLTGGFDALLSVSEDAVQEAARAMHEVGVLLQHEVRAAEGRIVEMCIGCPAIGRFERDDGQPAFAITTPIACWVSRADDPTDPGFSAIATTKTQARLKATAPGADGMARMTLFFEPRPPDEVRLHGQMTADQRDLLLPLLQSWVRQGRSETSAASLPAAPGKLERLSAGFATRGDLQVGLGFEGGFGTAGLPSAAAPEQAGTWSLALSRPFLARRVYAAFAEELGAAPPPLGSQPVLLSKSKGLYLDFLELALGDGELLLSGRLSKSGGPSVTAQFTAHVSLALTATGLIVPSVGDVDVEVAEWYANVADVLSGGAIRTALRNGIREALASSNGQGQLASFVTTDLLTSLAKGGTAANVSLRPKITAVEVKRKGLRLIGRIETPSPKGPQAELHVVAAPAGKPTLLYGGRSSVPGSELAEVRWDLGDGTKRVLSGPNASLVIGHAYAAGTQKPVMTVIDADGRQDTAATTVRIVS